MRGAPFFSITVDGSIGIFLGGAKTLKPVIRVERPVPQFGKWVAVEASNVKSLMRLYVLPLGKMMPGEVPVVGYLIQTDAAQNILVDTGFPHSFIENPPREGIVVREEDYVVNRLASIGLKPNDIDIVVSTHFDTDHVGNNEAFPNALHVVQRKHHELASAGHPRFERSRTHWDFPGAKFRLLDGDTTLSPGVELLETGGHVPYHQSVLVRLANAGPILLAIDAIPHSSMRDPDTREIHAFDMDEAEVRSSTRKLSELVQNEGVQLVIYGHDSGLWPALKHAPEFYD